MWATQESGLLTRIDPLTNRAIASIALGGAPAALAAGRKVLWVGVYDGSGPRAGAHRRSHDQLDHEHVAAGAGHEPPVVRGRHAVGRVELSGQPRVASIDPADGRMSAVREHELPETSADGALWATANGAARIDPSNGSTVATVDAGNVDQVAAGLGAVWVLTRTGSRSRTLYQPDPRRPATVVAIDPATNRIVGAPVPVGISPAHMTVGSGAVWVAQYDTGVVTRVELALSEPAALNRCRRPPAPTRATIRRSPRNGSDTSRSTVTTASDELGVASARHECRAVVRRVVGRDLGGRPLRRDEQFLRRGECGRVRRRLHAVLRGQDLQDVHRRERAPPCNQQQGRGDHRHRTDAPSERSAGSSWTPSFLSHGRASGQAYLRRKEPPNDRDRDRRVVGHRHRDGSIRRRSALDRHRDARAVERRRRVRRRFANAALVVGHGGLPRPGAGRLLEHQLILCQETDLQQGEADHQQERQHERELDA